MFCYNWSEFPTSWNKTIFDTLYVSIKRCTSYSNYCLYHHNADCFDDTLFKGTYLDDTRLDRARSQSLKEKGNRPIRGQSTAWFEGIHKHTKSSYAYHHYLYNECHTMRDAMLCFSLLPIVVALCDSSYLIFPKYGPFTIPLPLLDK